MTTAHLFSDKSDIYAKNRPLYPQAFFDWIKSHLNGTDLAWDCATGSGQAALGLADIFKQVEATDISENQLAQAFPVPNIRYTVSSAEKTAFNDHCFDMVNVAQALHWFDIPAFFGEVRRVLKPSGLFTVSCYSAHQVTPEIDQVVTRTVSDIIYPYWAANNQLCWNGYAAIDFPFTPLTTPRFAMTAQWDLNRLFGYIHSWSATRRCMEEIGESFFDDAYARVRNIWGDPKQTYTVTFPMTVIAGHVE